MNFHPLPMKLFCVAFLAIAIIASRTAVCDEPVDIHVDIELSVIPEQPTAWSDTLLHVRFPNFAVGVLSTFVPDVSFDNNSILVSLHYQAPDGDVTIPSMRFYPEETINLGQLTEGTYNVVAMFPSPTGVSLGSAELGFTVAPEPSTMALIAMVVLVGGIVTRRKPILFHAR